MENIFIHEKFFMFFGKLSNRDQSHHTMIVNLNIGALEPYCTNLVVFSRPQAEISTTQHIFQGRYIVEVSRLYKKYLINPQGQIRPKNRFPVVISPSDTFSHCHAQPFSNWNSGVLGKSANSAMLEQLKCCRQKVLRNKKYILGYYGSWRIQRTNKRASKLITRLYRRGRRSHISGLQGGSILILYIVTFHNR